MVSEVRHGDDGDKTDKEGLHLIKGEKQHRPFQKLKRPTSMNADQVLRGLSDVLTQTGEQITRVSKEMAQVNSILMLTGLTPEHCRELSHVQGVQKGSMYDKVIYKPEVWDQAQVETAVQRIKDLGIDAQILEGQRFGVAIKLLSKQS